MGVSFDNIYLNLVLSLALVVLSGLFSGLTLGLMSLDKVGLRIVAEAGEREERIYAAKIAPVRANGNLLLCTLLIGNTVVNAFLAIILADLTDGFLGLIVSTGLIVLFGEIGPQAICSRHGLLVGARTIWVTRFVLMVLFPVAYPISVVLDKVLGKEIGTVYTRQELKQLIAIHAENPEAQMESGLTQDDSHILAGVLEYKDKCIKDVMTTIDKTFMLEISVKLNFDVMLDIYKSGYTRIPVYQGVRQNILGVLFTKDLILIDPDDEIEVRTLLAFHGLKHAMFIQDNTLLHDVLNIFKNSYTHLMMAVDSSANQVTGVITLEDVLEELIKTEIVDETDNFVSNDHRQAIKRDKNRPPVTEFLKLFGHKLRHNTALSPEEVLAVSMYLKASMAEFKIFSDSVLRSLVRKAEVIELVENQNDALLSSDASTQGMFDEEGKLVLYRKGDKSNFFSLLLQGHAVVKAGNEGITSDMGQWSCIGAGALESENYIPDFTAVCSSPCRVLRLNWTDYQQALAWAQVFCAGRYNSFASGLQ